MKARGVMATGATLGCLLGLAGTSMGCNDYNLTQFQAQDIFAQETAGSVDVLLVVDNSCSMQPYQQKLGDNFNDFLTYLQVGQVDYNIGVVTTTVDPPVAGPGCTQAVVDAIPAGGHLVGGTIIRDDTANAESAFKDLVAVGTCGSGYEMGLESAYLALTPPLSSDTSIHFLRDSAMLSLIFVSDEQDSSPQHVADYVNTFRRIKGYDDRTAFNASALVINDLADCSQQVQNGGSTPGTRYLEVADETSGLDGDICADDFSDILTDLSLRASRLRDTFYLTRLPAPATLFLTIDGVESPCSDGTWSYQTEGEGDTLVGKIVFERGSLPPPNSTITITYDYGSGDPAEFCTSDT